MRDPEHTFVWRAQVFFVYIITTMILLILLISIIFIPRWIGQHIYIAKRCTRENKIEVYEREPGAGSGVEVPQTEPYLVTHDDATHRLQLLPMRSALAYADNRELFFFFRKGFFFGVLVIIDDVFFCDADERERERSIERPTISETQCVIVPGQIS